MNLQVVFIRGDFSLSFKFRARGTEVFWPEAAGRRRAASPEDFMTTTFSYYVV